MLDKSKTGKLPSKGKRGGALPTGKGSLALQKTKRGLSLHQQILNDIEGNILSGHWPPGYRIPFEHELMEQYQCSRMTVNKVLTHLANIKLIERRRRAGSFVTKPHSTSAVLEIADIKTEVEDLGFAYNYEITTRHDKEASASDQAFLEVGKGAPLLELVVCHYANARPFCLEERLISLVAVPEAANEKFQELPPGSWLMRQVPWSTAEHRIRAVAVPLATAKKLNIFPESPGLVVERRTWSGDGPVTYVRLTYPADEHELVARFSPSSASTSSNGASASQS